MALVFTSYKQTMENLEDGIMELKEKQVKRIWGIPFFLPSNVLYQKALHAMQSRDWGIPIGMPETLKDRYFIDEILKERIEQLTKTQTKKTLVAIGYGAVVREEEATIKKGLEAFVKRMN